MRTSLALGLGAAASLFLWQVSAAAQRLVGVLGDYSSIKVEGLGKHLLLFEVRVLVLVLLSGLVLGAVSALFIRGVQAAFPRGVPAPAIGLRVGALALLLALLAGREMATHPALFEVWFARPDGTHGLLQVVADRLGLPVIQAALALYLACSVLGVLHAAWPLLRASRPRLRSVAAGLALAVAVAAAVAVRGAASRQNAGPNILIIAADSLRADHLSGEGYGRPTSPNIDALKRRGITLANLYVPQARTIPSWTTILTGLQPPEHGITTMFPSAEARQLMAPTLPTLLAPAGYYSAAVSDYAGDFFSLVDYGFTRTRAPPAMTATIVAEREAIVGVPFLFALFNNPLGKRLLPVLRFLPNNADPDSLTREVEEELEAARRRERFFLVAFYSVTHIPYAAPYPDFKAFGSPGYRGDSRYSYALRELSDLRRADKALPDADLAQAVALYDGAIRAFDRNVGELLAYLERTGLAENTTVVVMGDHGEVLRSGWGGMQHGNTLLDGDDLKTACIIAPPGASPAARRIENLLSAADLAPTLLRLLHRPVPDGMSGTAFLDEAGRPAAGAPRTVYLETGEWFQTAPPEDEDALPYPAVDQLLDTDASGHLVIRDRYRDLVEIAKQRGLFDGTTLARYLPRRGGARVEFSTIDGRTPPASAGGGGDQPAVRDRLVRKLAAQIGALPGARLDPKTRLLEFRFEQE